MDGNQITPVSLQRDLGILISCNLRWDQQVNESCKKANKVLGMIARNFTYKTRIILFPLYKTLIRPHLEAFPILGHDLEETRWANGAYPAPCYKTYSRIT